MAHLSKSFNDVSSMFGGFVRNMQNGSAQLVRGSLDAGSKFFNSVVEHASQESVAVVVKGILMSAGAAAATAMMPAIAPLVPAITGYIGQASLTAIMMQVGNFAAEVGSNVVAKMAVGSKKPDARPVLGHMAFA